MLELGSIEDAIARRMRVFSLGPGEWRYKRDLGGERVEAFRALATSPSPPGRALAAARQVRHRLRALQAQRPSRAEAGRP